MPETAITGLGPVAPNGIGRDSFWNAVAAGRSGIRRIKHLLDAECPCQIGGLIPEEWITTSPVELPSWLPESKICRFSVLAVQLALEDAGLTPADCARRDAAVYMGVSTLDMEVCHSEYQLYHDKSAADPDSLLSASPHTPAAVVSQFLQVRDEVITFSTACTAGAVSIGQAAEKILREEADLVVAGGVESSLSPFFMNVFSAAGLAPTGYNDAPDKASRPFDELRESGLISEGAGVVIIEDKKKALQRKAKIYADFSGMGMANGMPSSSMKSSFYRAMSGALSEAGLTPADIDHISACGPGHPLMDKIETRAVKELFGKCAYNIPISSLKSMIGNPGAAAGPLQVIAAALAMEHNYGPPTANLEQPGKGCDLDYVPVVGRVARINRVMVNLRGLGGGVVSLIISRPGLS